MQWASEKRKRVKNSVPFHERCKAKRANEAQCTRRRRDGSKFCGTHIKGTPHGEIVEEETDTIEKKKIQQIENHPKHSLSLMSEIKFPALQTNFNQKIFINVKVSFENVFFQVC